MAAGSQLASPDPRNEHVRIWVDGALVPREEAKISVFDSGFLLGDGVWEGIRLVRGRMAFLEEHLARLYDGARALAIEIPMDAAVLSAALEATLAANDMHDGVHVRLMVTRGRKVSPSQDPRATVGPATVVIVAEYKAPDPALATKGLALATSSIRTSPPEIFDMALNTHSRLNYVRALLDVIDKGADEALMLDHRGFVASCNATNFFAIRDGAVWTSTGEYCFRGVTRGQVIRICREHDIPIEEWNFTLADVRGAREAFVTGTFGGVTPVASLDGRRLGGNLPGPMTHRIGQLYRELLSEEARRPLA
jgi:branched-chain amino acid aminotransferase